MEFQVQSVYLIYARLLVCTTLNSAHPKKPYIFLKVTIYYIYCIMSFVSNPSTMFFVTHDYVTVTCDQMWHHANTNSKSKKIKMENKIK